MLLCSLATLCCVALSRTARTPFLRAHAQTSFDYSHSAGSERCATLDDPAPRCCSANKMAQLVSTTQQPTNRGLGSASGMVLFQPLDACDMALLTLILHHIDARVHWKPSQLTLAGCREV